jgi:hypothetical protein
MQINENRTLTKALLWGGELVYAGSGRRGREFLRGKKERQARWFGPAVEEEWLWMRVSRR